MDDYRAGRRVDSRILAVPEALMEVDDVKNENRTPARWLGAVMLLAPFLGIGVATSYWFFDSAFPGVMLGLGGYLLVILFVMVGDIVVINKELASFRKGVDDD